MRIHLAIVGVLALSAMAMHPDPGAPSLSQLQGAGKSEDASLQVAPLWFQGNGADDPVTVENNTPFPSSQLIVNAHWTTPRYYPNPKVQAADIIPVTWASDGHSYVIGDDGSVYGTRGTTVIARIIGLPPTDNTVPNIDFRLLAHDPFLYGCPKSVTENSCYSVGFTEVNRMFYAVTYDYGYPLVGDHPPGHAVMDYSPERISQNSWVHGTVDFPKPIDSGVVSIVEIGQGTPAWDGCSESTSPHGCIYAIVAEGGYQDPKDPGGIDQFNATELYLGRMAVGTPERHYAEVVDPRNWQWFAGFDPADRPTWVATTDPQLAQKIRSLSYPRDGHPGCAARRVHCQFWDQPAGHAGFVNYPHMA